ncbi:MAG: GNAT family N-acetyltransferase [Clostridiales bacterium]|nr:GNAT family N-acetyltransferase [Clostridiales bacterium]
MSCLLLKSSNNDCANTSYAKKVFSILFLHRSNLLIRSMVENDIALIVDGFKQQGWVKSQSIIASYYEEQQAATLFPFIAESENRIAGYVLLAPQASYGPFAGASIPEIRDFNVFIPYQNKGIGSHLLCCAEKKARQLSNKVSLGVGMHQGYGAAQRMYAKRGYLPHGSGLWYNNAPLAPYAPCKNDDGLILYLSKTL